MTGFMLQPNNETIVSEGKVTYQESMGAFNTIRLKKILIEQFPQLKDKQAHIKFKVEFHKSYEQLETAVAEMKKRKTGIPLLIYLFQEYFFLF